MSVLEYVREGPKSGETMLDFLLGGLLYWRIWAGGTVVTLGYVGGAYAAAIGGDSVAYTFGFIAGWVTLEAASRFAEPRLEGIEA